MPISTLEDAGKPKIFPIMITVISVISIITAFYIYEQYQSIKYTEMKKAQLLQNQHIQMSVSNLNSIVDDVDATIRKMVKSQQVKEFALRPSHDTLLGIEEMVYFVGLNQEFYSQLRFIDNGGKERIRINNLLGNTYVVPDHLLQNKSQRDYFQYAKHLQEGQIGTWGIDPQVEHGVPIEPIQPSLRVISPVFFEGVRYGYIVINLNVPKIFQSIHLPTSLNIAASILDAQGHFMSQQGQANLLTDLIISREAENIGVLNPLLWEKMKANPSGFVIDEEKLYSFEMLTLKQDFEMLGEYVLVSSSLQSNQDKQVLLLKSLMLVMLIIGMSMYLYRVYYHYEKAQMDQNLIDAAINGVAGVMVADFDFNIVKVNKEFSRVTGFGSQEVICRHIKALRLTIPNMSYIDLRAHLMEYGRWKGELSGKSKHGGDYTLLGRIQMIPNSKNNHSRTHFVMTFTDISKRKRLETTLRNQSESDPLTGVWNRRKFDRELEGLIDLSKRYTDTKACIGILDIDYFKQINDQLGHDKGDQALKQVAMFLKNQCRTTDIVARIGGEEFAILMPHSTISEGFSMMERLRSMIEKASDLSFTVSGGVAEIQRNSALSYKQADIALYGAKNSGRNRVQQYHLTV